MPGYHYRGTILDAHLPWPEPEKRTKASIAECGTTSGYNRHHRLREPVCNACYQAHLIYARNRRYAPRNGA